MSYNIGMNYPDILVAIDKKRDRIFILAKPALVAVKKDGEWHYGEKITDEEIELYYELIADLAVTSKIVAEAKAELRIP